MNNHLREVCRIGQGASCCRYLMMGAQGWECAKGGSLQVTLDERVAASSMTARGDNCAGQSFSFLNAT